MEKSQKTQTESLENLSRTQSQKTRRRRVFERHVYVLDLENRIIARDDSNCTRMKC